MFTEPANDSGLVSSVIRAQLDKAAPTGAIQSFSGSAPTGWVLCNGGTIGNASSGGTLRANADTSDLFEFLWNNFTNSELVIQDSSGVNTTRGISAAADFAANKRMPTPNRTPENAALKLIDIQYFTSSGTWTRPNGCTKAIVEVVGGGGGACTNTNAGSGGGYSKKTISNPSSTETVNVGAGGAGNSGGGFGTDGGTSSFGSHCSSTGGQGGRTFSPYSLGGSGSGGDINITGESGERFTTTVSGSTGRLGGRGGASPLGYGFGGVGWFVSGTGEGATGFSGVGYGAGGGVGTVTPGSGTSGIVIVYSYCESDDNRIIKL